MEIIELTDKKLVDYLSGYKDNSKIGLIFKHGVGDILMFLPYFDYLKSLYKNLVIHLLIIRDYEEQLYENRDDLVRINKEDNEINFEIYQQYNFLFNIKFREITLFEAFDDPTFNKQKAELCFLEEIGLNPSAISTSIVKLQTHKSRYIGFTFNRLGEVFNECFNVPYDIAKYMWFRTKQLGLIPIEILFIHPNYTVNKSSEKYDFVDRTTRDLVPNFGTVMSVMDTLRGYATIDNGMFHIAYNFLKHNNILFFDLITSLNYLTKFNDIEHFDFKHKELFTDEKFVKWLLNCNGEKIQ